VLNGFLHVSGRTKRALLSPLGDDVASPVRVGNHSSNGDGDCPTNDAVIYEGQSCDLLTVTSSDILMDDPEEVLKGQTVHRYFLLTEVPLTWLMLFLYQPNSLARSASAPWTTSCRTRRQRQRGGTILMN